MLSERKPLVEENTIKPKKPTMDSNEEEIKAPTKSKDDNSIKKSKNSAAEEPPMSRSNSMAQVKLKSSHLNPKAAEKIKPISTSNAIQRKLTSLDSWKAAHGFSKDCKVFIINGEYPDIRAALLERGWAENTDVNSTFYDFLWSRKGKVPILIKDWQVCNHFPKNQELVTKWRLCSNLKRLNAPKSGSSQFFPRCFKLKDEMNEFLEHYKILRITGRVKQFLEKNDEFLMEKLVLCIVILERWIDFNRRNTGGEQMTLMSNVEWRNLISNTPFDVSSYLKELKIDSLEETDKLMNLAKSCLERLSEADPQFFINGTGKIWIVKPGGKSRGRDIAIFSELNDIRNYVNNSEKWVIQKYIENPLLLDQRKFDIRQWVLISSSDPLIIWIYNECYLRFSVEKYNAENLNNLFVHLTNNSISKNSEAFDGIEDGCMWHIDRFKEQLFSIYGRDMWSEIFLKIKEIVKATILSVGNFGRRKSFEILGYDFMIDENLKPWLIEINSSPAMDYSTPVTELLVKQVLADLVKVVVDRKDSPICDTGKFEILYQGKVKLVGKIN
ncbi:unnamed protein product [Blepharisma stoltei]|uniref:ATP-grasp domain-containing protein n=1 Tax=Blepharisma stoltei TaxID=1481888 RepID=A0AAU9JYP1_9CILI|nr:unnamed protein product [Blepharisma stoltei]